MEHLLFSRGDLSTTIEKTKRVLSGEIESYNRDELLKSSDEQLCTYFVTKYQVDPIVLKLDQVSRDEPHEKDVDVSGDFQRLIRDRSRPAFVKGVSITVIIPFDGDAELFQCGPSSYFLTAPYGEVKGQELYLTYTQTIHDEATLKAEHERNLQLIKDYVSRVNLDVDAFNKSLPSFIDSILRHRKEKLLKDLKLGEALGIPLRRRADNAIQVVPSPTRRKAEIRKPAPTMDIVQREYFLEDQDYEYILKTITDMVRVMERSPRTFSKMIEEELRDILLVVLNAHYEGQATGETFNFKGRTDILIRNEGKNIFIAECKVWDGPEKYLGAIDQLLGYHSWRDTKTALILFNRSRNMSEVLQKIEDATPSHACYVGNLGKKSETEFRFTFHQTNDKNRRVYLAILVFDVPT